MPTEVEFQSGGETVRAHLYLPEGDGPHPVVVMAGGWCYVRELVQPIYAKAFAANGIAALVFDYRRLGASDGTPRQHINPNDQLEDYRNAITWVSARDDIDADQVSVWGISYSGGHVLILGASDWRVKNVISIVPVVDGYVNMRRVHGTVGFRALEKAIHEDRVKRYETGEYGYMSMSTANVGKELCTWPFPETYEAFNELKRTVAPAHEHRNTIASTEMLMNYSVYPFLPRLLDTPVLMVLAQGDDLTLWDKEIEVFGLIPTPKKELHVVPATKHMELYSDQSNIEVAAAKCAAWLSEQLAGAPVPAHA
jgi:pimeloyl-ACP methyl ester carboxylesterase